jgi:hypothetical protein
LLYGRFYNRCVEDGEEEKEKVILNQVIGVEDEVFLLDESFYDLQLFNYPCRIDIMLAALCTKGKMKIKINLKEYEITEGMIALYTPSNIIQIDYTNNFNAKVIVASTQFMKSIHIDIKNLLPLYMQVHNQSCQVLEKEYIQLYNKFFNLTKQIIILPNISHKLEVVQGIDDCMTKIPHEMGWIFLINIYLIFLS